VIKWTLKPKVVTYFIEEAAHYLTFIGAFKTFFKHHLMAFNKPLRRLQALLRLVAKLLSLSMEAVGDLPLHVNGHDAHKAPLHLANAV
jgi:hypothetical protein